MKKLLVLSLVAGVSFAAGRIFDGAPKAAAAVAGQGGGVEKCAATNGDVNADGLVNLSDAVTVLGHLFQGNPTQLLPLCAQPPAPSGLPDTGQTTCYDASPRNVVDCANDTCPGQDGTYTTGCPSEGRFVDNEDGTVTDNCAGLMWQQNTADVNGDGQTNGSDDPLWCDALAYCENLEFAGHDDWRLPNLRELQSIVDYGRGSPSIDPVFGAMSSYYWSSTSYAAIPGNAWLVSFIFGHIGHDGKGQTLYVRAVRSVP